MYNFHYKKNSAFSSMDHFQSKKATQFKMVSMSELYGKNKNLVK